MSGDEDFSTGKKTLTPRHAVHHVFTPRKTQATDPFRRATAIRCHREESGNWLRCIRTRYVAARQTGNCQGRWLIISSSGGYLWVALEMLYTCCQTMSLQSRYRNFSVSTNLGQCLMRSKSKLQFLRSTAFNISSSISNFSRIPF